MTPIDQRLYIAILEKAMTEYNALRQTKRDSEIRAWLSETGWFESWRFTINDMIITIRLNHDNKNTNEDYRIACNNWMACVYRSVGMGIPADKFDSAISSDILGERSFIRYVEISGDTEQAHEDLAMIKLALC